MENNNSSKGEIEGVVKNVDTVKKAHG